MESGDGGAASGGGSSSAKKAKTQGEGVTTARLAEEERRRLFDPDAVAALAAQYPDRYWVKQHAGPELLAKAGFAGEPGSIRQITAARPLRQKRELDHPGSVYCMNLSEDGRMMVSCSTLGTVRVWDASDWSLMGELKDVDEVNIDESFVVKVSPEGRRVFVGGKIKDRRGWDEEENENKIITKSDIKVYDLLSGKIVSRLEDHLEEILCLKLAVYKGDNYLLSSSQDGYVRKWPFDKDWNAHQPSIPMDDQVSDCVVSLSFVPNTGNQYFVAGTDTGVRLYDFGEALLLHTFPNEMYSSYCDNAKFVDAPLLRDGLRPGEYLLVTRGVELLEEVPEEERKKRSVRRRGADWSDAYYDSSDSDDDRPETRPIAQNKCDLWSFRLPTEAGGEWTMERIRSYVDDRYIANSWPMHIATNGYNICAPTNEGWVIVWDLHTGATVDTFVAHDKVEIRDMMFHPTHNEFLTCGDDQRIVVWRQAEPGEVAAEEAAAQVAEAERQKRREERERKRKERESMWS